MCYVIILIQLWYEIHLQEPFHDAFGGFNFLTRLMPRSLGDIFCI